MFSVVPPMISGTKYPSSTHPWAKRIKAHYANKIKQAHNSVRNVVYPKLKEKIPNKNRIKFTVIGNRVTKEFIYCVNLVQGMYKYRWKNYDTPVIKGCTGVEWPKILNDLKRQYGDLIFCIDDPVAVLCNGKYIGGAKELQDLIESEYIYHLALNYQNESIKHFRNYLQSSGRPCAYMHISINEKPIGSLIFMLYSDVAPVTCENFLRLCQLRKGGYSGTPVHRIVQDGWIQCGGFGLKQTDMDCENFIVPHTKRGVLGMANAGRHIECSTQFYVLLQPNDWLNSRFVAFGQLIDGEETLRKIEEVETYYEAPAANIVIYSAGILNLDCREIRINKGTLEYLDGHVEDLVSLGEMLYELLIEKVWLEIQFRAMPKPIHEEDFEETDLRHRKANRSHSYKHFSIETFVTESSGNTSVRSELNENDEFDVEEYRCEHEETHSFSDMFKQTQKETKPYYIAFTDRPCSGDVDSTFDLKRLLQGDCCLEADLDPKQCKRPISKSINKLKIKELSRIISTQEGFGDSSPPELSTDLEEDRDISEYKSLNADHVCFSGEKIKSMSKQCLKGHPLEILNPKEVVADETIRLMRMALKNFKSQRGISFSLANALSPRQINWKWSPFLAPPTLHKKQQKIEEEEIEIVERDQRRVMIKDPMMTAEPRQFERRNTAFVRPEDLNLDEEEDSNIQMKKVSLKEPDEEEDEYPYKTKRSKGSVRISPPIVTHDPDDRRQSVLGRLFEDVNSDELAPTLKNYKPNKNIGKKKDKLAMSDEDTETPWLRRDKGVSPLQVKIDSRRERRHTKNKQRESAEPSMTVKEYREMNEERRIEELKREAEKRLEELKRQAEKFKLVHSGIRLPGDTPLYSPRISAEELEQAVQRHDKGRNNSLYSGRN